MSGLETDPKGQAKDALRGYVYQILRSLLVWVDLADRDEFIPQGAALCHRAPRAPKPAAQPAQ